MMPTSTLARSTLLHLECGACGLSHDPDRLWNLCSSCGKPLLAQYDLDRAARTLTPESLERRRPTMWRYEEVLPVADPASVIDLGEGWTPLHRVARLGEKIGAENVFIKDESVNPTGSFKARGLAAAISRALELGVEEVAIPSAGNAAGAAAAYAAAAGLKAHVFMPSDVPPVFIAECKALGASIELVDGLITDCGARVADGVKRFGWFDLSTLKEPYRIEGKKTMGYELAEQFDWALPEVVVYPTGGGTGLIGMWKAFDEMERMGLIGSERPRMVSVQAEGCAPIVRAFREGNDFAEPWEDAATVADGLRVPAAVGDFLMLRALRESNGTALTVTDEEMIESAKLMGSTTGIFPAPEGGACLAALVKLLEAEWVAPDESVVLFNTGTGLKYAHLFS